MTLVNDVRRAAPAWSLRPQLTLVEEQLAAIDRWNGARRLAEEAVATAARSREARLDQSRRLDVLHRQHSAVLARTAEQLRASAGLMHTSSERRVVLVHRNSWFRGRVADSLAERGISVVAQLDNGADAVGCVVAEQPDLLLVEDSLPMLPGGDVLRAVREYAPATLCGAQAEHEGRRRELYEAGASLVWTRRIVPADVASELGRLVGV